MAKVFKTEIFDELANRYYDCCKLDDEHILLARQNGIDKYNIFTKTLTTIYTPQTAAYQDIHFCSIYYKDGYLYTIETEYTPNSYAHRICIYDINTFSYTSYSPGIGGYYDYNSYIYEYGGMIRFFLYNDCYISRKQWSELWVYDCNPNTHEFSYIINLSTYSSSNLVVKPIQSIIKYDNNYKFYWYSFYTEIYDFEAVNWARNGYTYDLKPELLTSTTYDGEIGDYNAFDDDENYYIVTNKYIVSLNKETDETKIIANNTTNIPINRFSKIGENIFGIVSRGAQKYIVKISYIDYDLIYSISTQNGSEVLTEIYNQSPINKIRFSYENDEVVCTLTTNSGESYMHYKPKSQDGKVLRGFDLKPNSSQPYFYFNVDYDLILDRNIIFYEVYSEYKPPSKAFQLNLYKNSAEPNRVDKTNYLTQIGTLYGAFRDETSVTNMVITIQQPEFPQFNYVYIPIFNRYYYVTDIASIRQNLWEISLSVDVLMTYKNAILSCKGFVDRNEFISNPMLIDKKRVIEQGINIEVHEVLNDVFVDYPDADIDDTQFPLADVDTFFVLNGYKIKSRHHYD